MEHIYQYFLFIYLNLLQSYTKSPSTKSILIASFNIKRVKTRIAMAQHQQRQVQHLTTDELNAGCRLGLDSHADMSYVGCHARILEVYHGQMCNVQPFHDSYKAMENIPTVNAAFAHDTEEGQTYILNVNQALDFSAGMENSLLCPNHQSRTNGVITDDVPKCLDPSKQSTHSIIFPDKPIHLPLQMNGPISYLPVRYPSDEEMEFCVHLDLTSDDEWDPSLFHDIEGKISSMSVFPACDSQADNLYPDFDISLSHRLYVNAVTRSSHREV